MRFKLLYKGRRLDSSKSLKEAEIIEDTKVYIQILDPEDDGTEINKPQAEETQQTKQVAEAAQVMPEANQLPKAPKAGYKVSPEMAALHRMTLAQL